MEIGTQYWFRMYDIEFLDGAFDVAIINFIVENINFQVVEQGARSLLEYCGRYSV